MAGAQPGQCQKKKEQAKKAILADPNCGGRKWRFQQKRPRAFRLLVLDEATSAIDIEGERALLDRPLQLVPRPTIVMIAHRQETVRHCERVLVFEESRLVSDGAHETILGWSKTV
jgi:ABC-type transport system involved in cytochrome bd biosynthesis fused ATPase/permease subunit